MGAIIAKGIASLVGAGLALTIYHRYYQQAQGLLATNPDEQVFDRETCRRQSSQQHPWLKGENYQAQMTEWVLPYLASHRQEGALSLKKGGQLAYHYYGQAAPQGTLLVLHGLNEYKEKFDELIYYWHQERLEVVAVDLPGHGASHPLDTKGMIHVAHFDSYAQAVAELIQQLFPVVRRPVPLAVYGHSMGGAVATRIVQLYPGLVDGLILSSPMLAIDTGRIPFSMAHLLSWGLSHLGWGHAYAPKQGPFDPSRHQTYPYPNALTAQYQRGDYYYRRYLARGSLTWGASWSWLTTSLASSRQILSQSALDRIRIPVLIWRAEEDHHVLAGGIHRLARQLVNVEANLVEGVKHEIYLEDDELVEAYTTRIRCFVTDLSQAKDDVSKGR